MELIPIEDVRKRISYKDRKKKEDEVAKSIIEVYDEIFPCSDDVVNSEIKDRKYETIQERRRRNEATSVFDDDL